METETPMAGTHEKAIAVAVKQGRYSQLALKWAVENLTDEGQSLMLVHVRPKSQTFNRGAMFSHYEEMVSVCGEAVAKGLEQSYKDTLNLQVKQMFHPFLSYCKKKNVHCDEVVIEDDDIVQGIADFVLTKNIDLLVIGAGSKGGLFRRLKGPETAQKISKSVPYFCTVYTVAKGGVVSVKSASTAAQTPSLPHTQIQEPEIGIHQQSFTSQMEPRLLAVSASESLFQHGSVREFEFRSPLKNYGDSDFSWEGHAPADSDISFISSDREFFGRVSSNFSTDSSNWSFGSFASRQTSSSTNSTVKSSARSSNASYSPQYTMLELMQTKKMYEAACQEELDAKIASKPNPQNFKQGEEMDMVQGSSMLLAKLENDKDYHLPRSLTLLKGLPS